MTRPSDGGHPRRGGQFQRRRGPEKHESPGGLLPPGIEPDSTLAQICGISAESFRLYAVWANLLSPGWMGAVAGADQSCMACDFSIADETCKFVFAFTNIALAPDMGSSLFLCRRTGVHARPSC
jgi:hypothetical protein